MCALVCICVLVGDAILRKLSPPNLIVRLDERRAFTDLYMPSELNCYSVVYLCACSIVVMDLILYVDKFDIL